jgi:hypothetical protein
VTGVAGISYGMQRIDKLLFLDNLRFAQRADKRKIIFILIPLPISIEIPSLILWLKYID